MADARSDGTETIVRIGKSLAIHLLAAVLIVAVIYLVTNDFEDASTGERRRFADAEDMQASIAIVLATARGLMMRWALFSLSGGFVLSGLFLSVAQRRHPRNPSEGASRLPLWIGLLVVLLVLCFGFWWQQVSLGDVSTLLMPAGYLSALTAGTIGTLLAFYLATALSVVRTMKPSVPLSALLPSFWN